MAHETRLNRKRRRDGRQHSAAGRRQHLAADESAMDGAGWVAAPLAFSRGEKLMPWVVGVIAFLCYIGTMTPGMQMGDGTELATAAAVLGVPHPTGYPLYMLLTKLWLVLTVGGEVIQRTTLLNCVLMAAAAGLTSVIIKDLLRVVWRAEISKPLLWMAGLMGLLTAVLRFHWDNAVVTEVYALQFLLTLIFVRIVQRMDLAGGPSRRALLSLSVVFALAMAHHRLSVTLIVPYFAAWLWSWRREKSGSGVPPLNVSQAAAEHQHPFSPMRIKTVLIAAAILLSGAALYLYIPLRAAQHPPINWGNATTWTAFYNHVRGTEYLDRGLLKPGLGQQFSGDSARQFISLQTRQILGDLAGQIVATKEQLVPGPPGSQKVFVVSDSGKLLGALLLLLACWGYVRIARRGGAVTSMVIVLIAAQNLLVLYVYNIADIRDYYLFPFWAVVVGASLIAPPIQHGRRRLRYDASLYIIAGLMIQAGLSNRERCNRSSDISAELLSATILPESAEVMPPGSILITDDDAETFTTWYRQIVRRERRDVLNFAGNFVYMPWYKAFFTDQQIGEYQIALAEGVARSADEYTQQLRAAVIDKNAAVHPVFTSINDPAVLAALTRVYSVEPVDAVEVINHSLFDESTTTVLYRIKPKAPAAQ